MLPSDRLVIQKVSQEVDDDDAAAADDDDDTDDDAINIYYDEVCVCLFVSFLFIPKKFCWGPMWVTKNGHFLKKIS